MFVDRSSLLTDNPAQLNYGLAILDVDGDGAFEILVAGFGYRNLALKWNGSSFIDIADPVLADPERRAIGVAACDLDGDGREEIYILNTDTFTGAKQFGDRLFDIQVDRQGEHWVDLFSLPENRQVINKTAGRSVACVDRWGRGRYGFFVANYGGPMRLYELNPEGQLVNVAPEAGLALTTGGRGVVSLPLLSESMDIFTVNEGGGNFLFRNLGNGRFEELAQLLEIDDPSENGRGVTVIDMSGNGRFDLVYGNWEGPHRLYVQSRGGNFQEAAPPEMAKSSRIRTVIAADFDNDGYEELFFNNIGEPNRLFGWRGGGWTSLDLGDALEPTGLGTGAAVGDLDGDGRLELVIAHGESGLQPLSLFQTPENGNGWLRVLPLTAAGAPARGAVVTLVAGRAQRRVIDAGSGYLCQMEPVAHFGLGTETQVAQVEVRWPGGATQVIEAPEIRQTLRVPYPVS
ncbi:CRTAC1 family protein [Leptolyngbya sp. FACHB-261]|nr:CRTAC1 family protein [Leptolyngbya sp. FACHB-261]